MNGPKYITGPQLCQRYGITGMTLHRWQRHPEMAFPDPMVVNRRRYWLEDEIIAWERSRAKARAVA